MATKRTRTRSAAPQAEPATPPALDDEAKLDEVRELLRSQVIASLKAGTVRGSTLMAALKYVADEDKRLAEIAKNNPPQRDYDLPFEGATEDEPVRAYDLPFSDEVPTPVEPFAVVDLSSGR